MDLSKLVALLGAPALVSCVVTDDGEHTATVGTTVWSTGGVSGDGDGDGEYDDDGYCGGQCGECGDDGYDDGYDDGGCVFANCFDMEPGDDGGEVIEADVEIALTWTTPGDADPQDEVGTDLDIHLMREGGTWDEFPLDCFADNPTPEWPPAGMVGNPALSLSDDDGEGPEFARVEMAVAGVYQVGVHYRQDLGLGDSLATLRIFTNDVLVFEVAEVVMSEGEFLYVADINWPDGTAEPVEQLTPDFP